MKISVVIPTYNYGRFIGEALESLRAQTRSPDEIIIVDDGSEDNTEEVVLRFGEEVRYLKQQNSGVCVARNRGVEETSGDLIAFMDADDIWDASKLDKQTAIFESDPEVGLVHCGMREFDSDTGEVTNVYLDGEEGWIAGMIAEWNKPAVIGPGGTTMVKRVVFDLVGGFDPSLKNAEDWEFCFRVAKRFKVGFVREALVNYRIHPENAHKNIAEMERSALRAWTKVFDGSDPDIEKLKRRSYANLFKVLAASFLRQGHYFGFIRNAAKSLFYRPSLVGHFLTSRVRRDNHES
ncbi:MAG: glycosyltransferase [Aridibacter famidurans]|nr:glycosyltransferase [Aridibacter famidurans]